MLIMLTLNNGKSSESSLFFFALPHMSTTVCRLVLDVCGPGVMTCTERGEGTIDGGTALKARMLRSSGYRVLFINALPLCQPSAVEALQRAVHSNDAVALDRCISPLSFVVSRRGVVMPRTVGHFLLTAR
jgi:hypothetical protein